MTIYILAGIQFILFLAFIALVMHMGFIMRSFKNAVPYVPTSRKAVRKMIELANIENNEKIIDLGSGTGRIIFALGKVYTGEIIGIEKSFYLYFLSKLKLFFIRKKNIKLIRGDFRNYSLKDINVVMLFITPEGMKGIGKKLVEELPQGARIVSYIFPLENKTGFEEAKIPLKEKKKTNYFFVYNKL